MMNNITGLPGVLDSYEATPREIFVSGRDKARMLVGPSIIDGTKSGNALNDNTWLLWAGTLMGRITASGKWAPSVIGVTTQAYATGSGDTSLFVSAATAIEIARRIGTSGTFKVTGPPTAAGTVAVTTATFSAVNTSTGEITVSSIGAAKVVGSLIQPTDGSETVRSILCKAHGVKVADSLNTTRIDVLEDQLLDDGPSMIDSALIVNYPADSSLKTYVKTALKTYCPSLTFKDDKIG